MEMNLAFVLISHHSGAIIAIPKCDYEKKRANVAIDGSDFLDKWRLHMLYLKHG